MKGPIDFLVVKFKKPNFDGSVLSELQKQTEAGTINVLDVLVITKDKDGVLSSEELKDEKFAKSSGMISVDDVVEVGEGLENGDTVGLLIIEQVWARGLKEALNHAGAELISEGRIHPDAAKELK